jgi:hypothetical protein
VGFLQKGVEMKKFFMVCLFVAFTAVSCEYGWPAENQPTPADNTKSVLVPSNTGTTVAKEQAEVPQKCCNLTDKKIVYKNKRNIAPCAVQQGLNLSYCETGVDACCNRVSHKESFDVPACVPPCACKDNVTVSRDGKKVVHDYGRYEVVLKARRDGAIEVNYRKRLFDR